MTRVIIFFQKIGNYLTSIRLISFIWLIYKSGGIIIAIKILNIML